MARIGWNQVNNLPDTLDTSAFKLLLGTIPNSGSSQQLTLKCQQASIPGFSNEAWESNLHGYVKKFRGRKMFTRTLSVTYIETVDGATYRQLKAWDEFIAGSRSGNSQGFQREYSVQSELVVYNTIGAIAKRINFDNMFIQELSDIQLDGTSSQSALVQVTLSFDMIRVAGIPLL